MGEMVPPRRIVPETAIDHRPLPIRSEASRSLAPPDEEARRFVVQGTNASARMGLRLDARVVELPRRPLVIGREPGCAIACDDALLSGRHAELETRGGRVLVRDLNSTNGVYLNGERIVDQALASPGDWVSLGRGTLEVVEIGSLGGLDAVPPSSSRSPVERRRATQPGSALLSIAGVAERVLASEQSPQGEQILKLPLEHVLTRALRGKYVSAEDAHMAAILASRLAEAAGGGRWVRYCFQLYRALERPLPSHAVDRLYKVFHRASREDSSELTSYLAVLRELPAEALGDSGQELVRRIAGLEGLVGES